MGNVGEVARVAERDGEAFMVNFPLATNEHYQNKEGEEVSKIEWHRMVNMSGTFSSTVSEYAGLPIWVSNFIKRDRLAYDTLLCPGVIF